MESLLRHASQAYALIYFGAVIVMALLECVVPRRVPGDTLALRWFGNVAITVLDTIIVRALFPIAALGWSIVCSERGWGILNLLT